MDDPILSGDGGEPPRWIERILPYALLASAAMSFINELVWWYIYWRTSR